MPAPDWLPEGKRVVQGVARVDDMDEVFGIEQVLHVTFQITLTTSVRMKSGAWRTIREPRSCRALRE